MYGELMMALPTYGTIDWLIDCDIAFLLNIYLF